MKHYIILSTIVLLSFFQSLQAQSYCTASSEHVYYAYIARIQIGSIDQKSTEYYSSAGYTDYTAVSTDLPMGNHKLTLTHGIGSLSGSSYRMYKKIWIDLNQDGAFDATEVVGSTGISNTYSGSIDLNIPSSATMGETRMRIMASYNHISTNDSCNTFNYGEVEDYTVNIVPSVHILIIDAGNHARTVEKVITNKLLPTPLTDHDTENIDEVIFDLNGAIAYNSTENVNDYNPNYVPVDIVNKSSSVFSNDAAVELYNKFLDKEKFPTFPLIITSAGNEANVCTQSAYDFSVAQGGLSWYDDIAPYYSCDRDNPIPSDDCDLAQAYLLVKACDLGAAYIVQETDHAKDIIIVGSGTHLGSRPGPILKNRWISTYYQFNYADAAAGSPTTQGTSFSTPYVVKIAAEIKRRAPQYTNDQIAQLIFTTAIDIGDPGIDEDYGHGFLNPKGIFDELTRRENLLSEKRGEVLSANNFELESKIKLFPNPSNDYFQISGLSQSENYSIYNIFGSKVTKGQIDNNESIEIKNLNNGLYFLKLENGNTLKFIKK